MDRPLPAGGGWRGRHGESNLRAGGHATGHAARPGDQADYTETEWLTDFERALAMAKRLDRPVLIDFAASWCVPCQMMEEHVWPQEKVREVLSEQVVPLKVDMDAAGARSLVQRYSVQFVPTTLLANSRGEQLNRAGYVSADELVEFVNEVR